jgi:anaerobic selenocysteine-containing dehydrogenase
MIEKRSVCPHDCPDTCGLLVKVEDDRIVSVKGDPDHPFTKGVLCPKVNHYEQRVYSPLRILHPLKRVGRKGLGEFVRISWTEALDEIAARYKAIIQDHGAEAILPYSYAGTMGVVQFNAGHAFFHKLGASKLARTICSAAVEAGFAASMGPVPSSDIEAAVDSDLIVIWGSNTVSTNMHAWPFFMEARKKGASLVVIDPYRNRTAQLADRHLSIKPGTDAALALALMNVLIKNNLLDHDFIREQTLGFDRLAERVQEYPPSRVAEITNIEETEIVRLAEDYGRAARPYIRLGWGPARQLKGGMACRTISLLPALVGAVRKRGGGITRSTSPAFTLNTAVLTREDLAPPDVRTMNMVRLGQELHEAKNPPVKALHVYHSNPAVVAPDSSKVLAGLKNEGLFLVVQEQMMTETAMLADIVLPGATSMETTDLYRGYGHYYLQMAYPVIDPVGEARSTLAIFQDLATRFGFEEECFKWQEEEFIKRLIPEGSRYFEGITFEKLTDGRPVRLNVGATPLANGFATPSGRVEFYSETMAQQGLDPLPDGTPSVDPDGLGKYPLQLITPPRHYFLNSTFNEVATLQGKAGPPTVMVNPKDARERDLENGDTVRVFNDRGDVYVFLQICEDTRPGVVVIEGLYWPRFMPLYRGVNQLTSQRLTDMGQTCAFHCNLVELESAT